jgi:PmbA protein
MEKLLKMARKVSDHAEVFSIDEKQNRVSYENATLKNINSSIQSGMSLRIIKENKVGFAYTKNLLDRDGFVQNALDCLKGGAEAPEGFPKTGDMPLLSTYDPSIDSVTTETMVKECQRICDKFADMTNAQLNLHAGLNTNTIRLLNSQGTNLTCKTSYYHITPHLLYPGSYSSIYRTFVRKSFEKTPEAILAHILNTFVASEKEVKPLAGRMKVLFLPESLHVLMWRLQSATNGKMLYQKQSPLLDKIGAKIFDEKLTILDNPLNEEVPGARAFDDEGTPCSALPLVEKGVLKNYYYDLFYAKKLAAEPSGHGYKSAMWGRDTVSLKPGSGNIPNGDFSIGLSPGLYVENGEIVGHVKDAMVAGNIYETLRNFIALEDTQHLGFGGCFPAILVDNVNVATKRG